MKLTFDPKYNIGYISFRDKTAAVETLHISKDLNIDLAPDGTIYGIELLNANQQLATNLSRKLIVENMSTGQSREIELPV